MRRLLSIIFLISFIAATGHSQDAKRLFVYLGTGGAIPTGDFNIKYNAGINGFVGLGIGVARNFQLVPKIEFQSLAIDPFAFADTINGGDYTGLYVGVDARYAVRFPGWFFRPTGQIGLGLAFSHFDQLIEGADVIPALTESDFYGSVGIGVDFALSAGVRGFVLARYTQIASGPGKREFFPLSAGIIF
jgi:hypothetical protein